MSLTVSQQNHTLIEIIVFGGGAILGPFVAHYQGLYPAVVIGVVIAIFAACRSYVLQTHEEKRRSEMLSTKSMSQQEYEELRKQGQTDEKTVYFTTDSASKNREK